MSYGIGPDLETKERKEQLLACYAIKCDCPYCKENWFCKSMPKVNMMLLLSLTELNKKKNCCNIYKCRLKLLYIFIKNFRMAPNF